MPKRPSSGLRSPNMPTSTSPLASGGARSHVLLRSDLACGTGAKGFTDQMSQPLHKTSKKQDLLL